MKKTICMILALVLCFGLLAGCGSSNEPAANTGSTAGTGTGTTTGTTVGNTNTAGSATEGGTAATPPPAEATYKDTLVYLLDDKVSVCDPFNTGSMVSQIGKVFHMVYDTLIDYTIEGNLEPCLATEWSANEDYTVLTFKLREGVKFHNGEPFTSDDVRFTIEKGRDCPGAPIYDRVKHIVDIETPDDYTIIMTLDAPNYDFFSECSNIVGFVICNREACEADPDNGPMVGTGPYAITEFVSSESITYERNEDYFGEKPITRCWIQRYVAEETARYLMFESGEADFVVVNAANIPRFIDNPNYTMSSFVVNNCGYIALNCQKAPLDDINFRLAVAYAVNDEEIVQLAFGGFAAAHDTGAMWGWSAAYKATDIEKRTQDLELAKEYLAKSSYDGRTIEVAASMPHTKKIAAVVMAELQAIGINAAVYECDGPTLTAKTLWGQNELDIVANSQVFTTLGKSINSAVTANNSNKAYFINEECEELVAKADVTPDGPEREALYHRIQEILYEEVPYVTTAHNALYEATKPGTGGARYFSSAYVDYSMAYVMIEE